MKNLVHRINRILAGFAGWLMIAMMLLLVVDIVGRAINMPLQLMAELSVFVMMIVIYLGFPRCEEHGEHVGLEIVANQLPPRGRAVMAVVSQTLGRWDHLPAVLCGHHRCMVGVQDQQFHRRHRRPADLADQIHHGGSAWSFFVLQGLINLGNAVRRLRDGDAK